MSALQVARATIPALALILAAWSTAGCTIGPRYVRPADPTQTGYLPPANAIPSASTQPTDAITAVGPHVLMGIGPSERWWALLGSADIDALVMRALQNNQSLAAAKAHLAAAQEHLRAARGAWSADGTSLVLEVQTLGGDDVARVTLVFGDRTVEVSADYAGGFKVKREGRADD